MPNAATAYPRYQERPSQPDLRVVRGGGKRSEHREPILGIWHSVAFRVFCIAAVCIACFCVARVALAAATVTTLMSSQEMTVQIESAYSTSADLEVQRSVLASPTRIQAIASEQLGMGPAASISYLDVSNARSTVRVGAVSDTECALSAAVTQIAASA